jgi:uncharacterized protein (TIRG00374 family)
MFFVGRKSIALMALGLVAFILYLWIFVGFDGLFRLLSGLNILQYSMFFSLAVLALFLAVFFDSLIWHSLLSSQSVKVKFRRIFLYNWIGNFIELIIPSATVGGEVARIALISKDTKDTGVAAATVIASRVTSEIVYSSGLLVGVLLLLLSNQLPVYLITPVILVATGSASVLVLLFLVVFVNSAVGKIVNFSMFVAKRFIKNPERLNSIKEKIESTLLSFREVFRSLKKHPRKLVKPTIFAIITWVCYLFLYLMIFYSLNFTSISIIDLASVYCIITTVETLTAGFPVGAVEVTMINLFALYGVPLAVAAAATTLTRLLTFWCQALVGYSMVQWIGAKSLLKGELKNAPQIPPPPSPPVNPPIVSQGNEVPIVEVA